MLESTASPASTTAAAVSSQEDSMPRIRTSSTLARVPGWPGGRQMRGSFWSQPELHRHVVVGVCRGCRSFTAGPKRHLASVRSVEYVIFDSWGRRGFYSFFAKRAKGAG